MTGARRLLGSVPNGVSHQARCGVLIVRTRSSSGTDGSELTGGPIVVGTDGSDRAGLAVKESIRLAKALGGELHIALSYKGLADRQHPDAALEEAAASARAEGVIATTHASELDPTDALLDVAERADAAMVVVGSKGMHGTERLALGSVPNQISHKGLCNVLIVYTGAPKTGSSD
jgi:nucleotide-binding universal stress UspA family protein